MDIVWRWLKRYGRPVALYSDRHSIFEAQDKGRLLPDAETQFGRALRELGIDLIRAHSPQAKGRVERSFATAQDRWVKELRLAGASSGAAANEVLGRLLPAHNRRFAKAARQATDAHRPLGPGHDLAAILSIQERRVVANDYTVRFRNRFYQLKKPVYPGERGGQVVIELRLDGTMAIRLGAQYLRYEEVAAGGEAPGGAAPQTPRSLAPGGPTPGEGGEGPAPGEGAGPAGVQPTAGRSGRTPAEPYPPGGGEEDSRKRAPGPGKDHPWRRPFKRQK